MQRLEVSGAVRLIYRSLGVKGLSWLIAKIILRCTFSKTSKTWSVVLLNKKYIYSYLKCIMYDKLLKPRQSFRITLYSYTVTVKETRIQKDVHDRRIVKSQMKL